MGLGLLGSFAAGMLVQERWDAAQWQKHVVTCPYPERVIAVHSNLSYVDCLYESKPFVAKKVVRYDRQRTDRD